MNQVFFVIVFMHDKELINPKHDLSSPDLDLSSFSDKDLYHLCQRYGNGIKMLRRVFAILLVEVNRRRLHRKYGFEGIYEFAAKVGGMNKALVDQILWLAEALKDKPCLWLGFKREGWSKVRVVASVATKETDKIWAEKIRDLSKPALEVLVQAWRKQNEEKNKQKKIREENLNKNLFNFVNSENSTYAQKNVLNNFPKDGNKNSNLAFSEPKNTMGPVFGEVNSEDLHGKHELVRMRFKVSRETEFRFLLFKQKLCKKRKEAMTSGEVLAILLARAVDNGFMK